MKTMMVTVVAVEDQEAVAECQGELDLTTFEVTDLTDESFVRATDDTYEGFSIDIEGELYALSVDYFATGNEFMVMDSQAIEAIIDYANANPSLIDGEDDILTEEQLEEE